ncbi:hypothetical protein [Pseudoruegeria sp. SK021]|uniref:hypothetical protein n=1 Tax=Pseudoruegeria sp. SK021 TaxID=1933035 RepID=UPI000A233D22|nr:hypothetical protein [Pseudoruegeria sp. SK021]OSP54513.1 hypothetical protein BV911_12325 [Pseudoruegeria sp. SK021]
MGSARYFGYGLVGAMMGLLGSQAQAQELQMVDQLGDWTLYYSKALGDSCLASRTDAEGRQFQVGVDRKKELAYAGLFAKVEAGTTEGDFVPVAMTLGETIFTGEAKEYNKEGVQGGYVFFNNLNFAYELAKQQTLIVDRSNGESVTVDLTGSAKAIEAVIDCQIATMQ